MIEEEIKNIDDEIKNANNMGYDRLAELLEEIKNSIKSEDIEFMKNTLLDLVDYITIY